MYYCQRCFMMSASGACRCQSASVPAPRPEAAHRFSWASQPALAGKSVSPEATVEARAESLPEQWDPTPWDQQAFDAYIGRMAKPTPASARALMVPAIITFFMLVLPASFSSTSEDSPWHSAAVAASIGSEPRDPRHQEILEAVVSIRRLQVQLESRLVSRGGKAAPDDAQWRSSWRREMEQVKSRYRLWGVVDGNHRDSDAEGGLRNAVLYLYTLERLGFEPQTPETSDQIERLRASIESCLDSVNPLTSR